MNPELHGEGTAAALRRAFDRSFAEARGVNLDAAAGFLAIRVGGDPYAVPLAGLASLHVDRRVVPIPGPAADLLGIAGFRGALVPIHDLRVLLGYPGVGTPRWILLLHGPTLVGIAFDAFERHLQLAADQVSVDENAAPSLPHVRGSVRAADGIRPLIHVASLYGAVTRQVSPDSLSKES